MILYQVSTMYHLLCCVCHKLNLRPNRKAKLYIVEFLLPPDPLAAMVERLQACGWFEEVVVVPEARIGAELRGFRLSKNSKPADIEAAIAKRCQLLAKYVSINFGEFNEFNIVPAHWSIGTHLLANRIGFNLFEDGAGIFSNMELYKRIIRHSQTAFCIADHLGAFCESDLIQAMYGDRDKQSANFDAGKFVDFSLTKNLALLSAENIGKLISLFDMPRIEIDGSKKTVVFMSQSIRNMKINRIEEQKLLFTLLVDYFAPNYHIVVKPHPKDMWINYQTLFPDCDLLKSFFPSELLEYALSGGGRMLDLGLTASSSSIHGIDKILKKSLYFTARIETEYRRIHRYYAASRLVRRLLKVEIYALLTHGLYDELLNELMEENGQHGRFLPLVQGEGEPGPRLIVLGARPDERDTSPAQTLACVGGEDVAIFIGNFTDLLEVGDDWETLRHLIPVEIVHKSTDSAKVGLETIYAYTKSQKAREIIMGFQEKKHLKYTELNLGIHAVSAEADIKIKVLEGQIRAMRSERKKMMCMISTFTGEPVAPEENTVDPE